MSIFDIALEKRFTDSQGTFYRWFADDLSGSKTAAELVAIDWAANNGRFS